VEVATEWSEFFGPIVLKAGIAMIGRLLFAQNPLQSSVSISKCTLTEAFRTVMHADRLANSFFDTFVSMATVIRELATPALVGGIMLV
jgi:hypothetical protein